MSNVNFKMRPDEEIFLYVSYKEQSSYIKIAFRSHDKYHLILVKEAISAAFSGFYVDDCDFYWKEVLIPDKDLVKLIKAKQTCGHFSIILKEKDYTIQDSMNDVDVVEVSNYVPPRSLHVNAPRTIGNSIISQEDSYVEEIHQFIHEEEAFENDIISVEEFEDSIVDPRYSYENEQIHKCEDMDLEEAHTMVDHSKVPVLRIKIPKSENNKSVESVSNEEVAKLKNFFDANSETKLHLLLNNPRTAQNRYTIINCATKYLFEVYGDFPHVSHQRHLVDILLEVFKPLKNIRKKVVKWLSTKVSNTRRKSKMLTLTKVDSDDENLNDAGTSESEPENATSDEDLKMLIKKFKSFCKANSVQNLLSVEDPFTAINRRGIIDIAVKYLFEECGASVVPNESQRSLLVRILIEVFKPFRQNIDQLSKWIYEECFNKRPQIKKEVPTPEHSNKRKKVESSVEDSDNEPPEKPESISQDQSRPLRSKRSRTSGGTSGETFDDQFRRFKKYCIYSLGEEILTIDDPLKPDNRKNIIHCSTQFLFDESGMFPSAEDRSVMVRNLVKLFKPFKKVEDDIEKRLKDKIVNLRRQLKCERKQSKRSLNKLNESKKVTDIDSFSEGEPEYFTKSLQNQSTTSTNSFDKKTPVDSFMEEVLKFKEYFNTHAETKIHMIDDPITQENRYDIINCAVRYLIDDCGPYPDSVQKRNLARILGNLFEPYKNIESKVNKWIRVKVYNLRRKSETGERRLSKQDKIIQSDTDESEDEYSPSNGRSTEEPKISVEKFKEYLKENLGSKILLLEDASSPSNRYDIIHCAVQYLFKECGNFPRLTQQAPLVKVLIEVFESFRPVEHLLVKWVSSKVQSLRRTLNKDEKRVTKVKESPINIKHETDLDDSESTNESEDEEQEEMPDESEITKFKEYLVANSKSNPLEFIDPLEVVNRRNIVFCSVKYIIDEYGVYPTTAERGYLAKLIIAVFKPFKGVKNQLTKWILDTLRNRRCKLRKDGEILTKSRAGNENDSDGSESSEAEPENIVLNQPENNIELNEPTELEIERFKEYFDANAETNIHLLGDPLVNKTRYTIINCGYQYLLDEYGPHPDIHKKRHLIKILVSIFEPFKKLKEEVMMKWIRTRIEYMRQKESKKLKAKTKRPKKVETESEDNDCNDEVNHENVTMDEPTEKDILKFQAYFDANAETKINMLGNPMEKKNRYIIINCAYQYLIDNFGSDEDGTKKRYVAKILAEVFEPFKDIEKQIQKWLYTRMHNLKRNERNASLDSSIRIKREESDIEDYDAQMMQVSTKIEEIDSSYCANQSIIIVRTGGQNELLAGDVNTIPQDELKSENINGEIDVEGILDPNKKSADCNTESIFEKVEDQLKLLESSNDDIQQIPEALCHTEKNKIKDSQVNQMEPTPEALDDKASKIENTEDLMKYLEKSPKDEEVQVKASNSEENDRKLYEAFSDIDDINKIQELLKDTLPRRIEQMSNIEFSVFKTYKCFSTSLDLIMYDFNLRFPSVKNNIVDNIQSVLCASGSLYVSETKLDLPGEDFAPSIRQFLALFHYTDTSESGIPFTIPAMLDQFITFSKMDDEVTPEFKDHPIIVARGNSKKDIQKYFIQMESTLIDLPEKTEFIQAFDYLVRSYYVFNVDFPKELSVFMNFIITNVYRLHIKSKLNTGEVKIDDLPSQSKEFWERMEGSNLILKI